MLDWEHMREVWRGQRPTADTLARDAGLSKSFARRLLKALAKGEQTGMSADNAERLRAIGWLPARFVGPDAGFLEAKRARIRQLAAEAHLPAPVGEAFAEAAEAIVAAEDAILRNQMTNLQGELAGMGDAVQALRTANDIGRMPELSRRIVGKVLGNQTSPTWGLVDGLTGIIAEIKRQHGRNAA